MCSVNVAVFPTPVCKNLICKVLQSKTLTGVFCILHFLLFKAGLQSLVRVVPPVSGRTRWLETQLRKNKTKQYTKQQQQKEKKKKKRCRARAESARWCRPLIHQRVMWINPGLSLCWILTAGQEEQDAVKLHFSDCAEFHLREQRKHRCILKSRRARVCSSNLSPRLFRMIAAIFHLDI